MFILPISNTAFYGGNIKLIGFKSEDLSKNFDQIYNLAKKEKIDFSILKTSSINARKDAYSIIASMDISREPYKIHSTTVAQVYKSASKDAATLNILSSILDTIDLLNEKLRKLSYNSKKTAD